MYAYTLKQILETILVSEMIIYSTILGIVFQIEKVSVLGQEA